MENLINELYDGNICPVEQMGGTTPYFWGKKKIRAGWHAENA